MQRFYHKANIHKFWIRHKKQIILLSFFVFLIIYLMPVLVYIPTGLKIVSSLVLPQNSLKSDNGRTNILVLGLDGRKYSETSNTDTIIFASLDLNKKQNVMLSIPRDLWVSELNTKVNDAYPSGNKNNGQGLEIASKAISSIVGHSVHYSIAISFEGFVKIIDALGGVDIVVERSFVDDSYPIAGKETDMCNGDPKTLCRWEILSFKKGFNHFDGITALKFVRSRHSRGVEGTDFARAARQQKIITAVKNKIFSPELVFNPQKIKNILQIIKDSVDSNISENEYVLLAKLALASNTTPNRTEIFPWDESVNLNGGLVPKSGILYHPNISLKYKNEWVLLPIGDSYAPIHSWVNCLMAEKECPPENFVKK